MLGAYDNANDELAQTLTLPTGTTLTLRFWWQMTTLEANHPWDTLDVTVTPAGGGTPVRLLRITDGDPAGVWQQAVLDLSPHAGQSGAALLPHGQPTATGPRTSTSTISAWKRVRARGQRPL